jgi:hypothetical protein
MARLVMWWVRRYTRDLPPEAAARRADEIAADLHDHVAHERGAGTGERRIALQIVSRMVRGLPADTAWRRRHRPATGRQPVARAAWATAAILLVPAGAMLSGGAAWGPLDFLLAGALLMGTMLALQAAADRTGRPAYRAAVGVALGAALLLVFLVAAGGIIGEVGDPADLMYAAVLATGVAGAVLARLRPAGMVRTLAAMAAVQAVVAAIALAAGEQDAPGTSVAEILGINALFVALFATSALLFRRAARRGRGAPTPSPTAGRPDPAPARRTTPRTGQRGAPGPPARRSRPAMPGRRRRCR